MSYWLLWDMFCAIGSIIMLVVVNITRDFSKREKLFYTILFGISFVFYTSVIFLDYVKI